MGGKQIRRNRRPFSVRNIRLTKSKVVDFMLPEGETTIPSSPGEPLHPCSQEVASRACRSRRCSTMLSGSNGHSGAADMMPAVLLRGFGLGFLFLFFMLFYFAQ